MMRWPFISRAHHDLALSQLAYFRDKADRWEQRYLDATKPKEAPKPAEQPVDIVARAIREASGSNGALRGHLAHFARTEREKGTSDEKIVADIRKYADGVPERPQSERREREEANAVVAEILDGV